MTDSLAREAVAPLLRGRFGRDVYRYAPRCASTQLLLDPDEPEGAVAVTDEQTHGRGRLGRTWTAPPGTSILCSLQLRPDVEPPRLPELSLVAGAAVAEAVAQLTGLEPELKFPNDVLVGRRKVAGILAEAKDGRVVLGVGINVNQRAQELPRDAATPPTSLRLESGRIEPRAELLALVLERLERRYDDWISGRGEAPRA
jgi:BirA family transcriptional regulator, biotin operon repressor / biotin---[acetyl-CoA-carboxylase] ligase